jgi:hypothetical protein
VPYRSTYLTENEDERLVEIGKRYDVGAATMIHLAVKAFLGDPLPRWAEDLLAELVTSA